MRKSSSTIVKESMLICTCREEQTALHPKNEKRQFQYSLLENEEQCGMHPSGKRFPNEKLKLKI